MCSIRETNGLHRHTSDGTRRDATGRVGGDGISALTTPLNHSSTGSELASVNTRPPACITLIFAKRYEINVHLLLRLLLSHLLPSFSSLVRRPFNPRGPPMALERESIMVADALDIQRLFAHAGKGSGLVEVSISGVYTIDYIIVKRGSSQTATHTHRRERETLTHSFFPVSLSLLTRARALSKLS